MRGFFISKNFIFSVTLSSRIVEINRNCYHYPQPCSGQLVAILNILIMKTVVQLNKWANAHTNVLVDVLRVALGLFLVFKGIQFASRTDYVEHALGPMGKSLGVSFILVHYVAMAHLFGGALITFGLLTRLCILVQLPILIGAVAVNFAGEMDVSALLQATAALLASVFFAIYGSGKHSADYNLKMNM